MKRSHAVVISLLLGVAIVAGGLAVLRTAGVGSSGQTAAAASDQLVAQRTAALDEYEASLRKALAEKPPKLPALTKASKPAPASVPTPKVVYVRAQAPASPPHAGSSDEGDEHGDEGEGGGFDD